MPAVNETNVGERYVIKDYVLRYDKSESDTEAEFLLNLNHPNIVKMFEYRRIGQAVRADG